MSRKAFSTAKMIPLLLHTAREAGALIMGYYGTGHAVDRKGDNSPVTEADRAADRLIVQQLEALAPDIAIVSEEGQKPDVGGHEHFWLVDPLDGTKSFIRGTGYFTVNIGLIEQGQPILGIVYDPVHKLMYWGSEAGAFIAQDKQAEKPMHARTPNSAPSAYISHSHINQATQDYLTAHGIGERIPCASSIKFCFLAEGKADFYPRFGPTMEWDTAAGHAVLAAAGGKIVTPEGAPLRYGKEGFLNGNFIASGK